MPPDALILAQNAPKCVWRPGSARTRWGSLSAPPNPLAAKRGPTSKGRGREGREGEGWEGRGEEGRGRKGKGSPLPRNPRSATGAPHINPLTYLLTYLVIVEIKVVYLVFSRHGVQRKSYVYCMASSCPLLVTSRKCTKSNGVCVPRNIYGYCNSTYIMPPTLG